MGERYRQVSRFRLHHQEIYEVLVCWWSNKVRYSSIGAVYNHGGIILPLEAVDVFLDLFKIQMIL